MSRRSLELSALRTICNGKAPGRKMMSRARDDWFYTHSANTIYCRVKVVYGRKGVIPGWRDLEDDPIIPEDIRHEMQHVKPLVKAAGKLTKEHEETLEGAARNLTSYARMRSYVDLALKIRDANADMNNGKGVDMDALDVDVSRSILSMNDADYTADSFQINNSDHMAEYLKGLGDERRLHGVPTFFPSWDSRNACIPYGSLWLLGANTGGGKSLMALTILRRMAQNGVRVCMASPEMGKVDILDRVVAGISGIDYQKIVSGQLTGNEIKAIKERYKLWRDHCRETGGIFHVLDIKGVPSMDRILHDSAICNPQVLCIDHMGLLKEAMGERSWELLGEAAMKARGHAQRHRMVIMALIHINRINGGKETEVKYAKRIEYHADYAWHWYTDREAREQGVIEINETKCRGRIPVFPKFSVDVERQEVNDARQAPE